MSRTELVRYETARRALAEARRVDEVKDIRDKAVAMQVYAKQAKDQELIRHATEIRLRAEIRAGELLAEMKSRGGREAKGGDRKSKSQPATLIPKLVDLGVSKTQSSRWQKLAGLPKIEQEQRIEAAKQATGRAIERASQRPSVRTPPVAAKPRKPPAKPPRRDDIGPSSVGEMARKDVEIADLCNAKRMLEIKIAGLETEIEELKTVAKSPPESTCCSICHEKKQAVLRPIFICDNCVDIYEVREAAPSDGGLDISAGVAMALFEPRQRNSARRGK